MATSKGAKRAPESALDANNWNTLERLILAQALYELGVDNLTQVATLMASHPMLPHPKSFYSTKSCSTVYEKLMEEASLTRPEPAGSRHAIQLQQLANIYYQQRTAELKNDIEAEETKFKTIVREIDEIRAGLWDDRIRRGGLINASEGPSPNDSTVGNAESAPTTVEENVVPAVEEVATSAVPPTEGDEDASTVPEIVASTPSREKTAISSAPEEAMEIPTQGFEFTEASNQDAPVEDEEDVHQEVEKAVDEAEVMEEHQVQEITQPQEVEEPEAEPGAESEAAIEVPTAGSPEARGETQKIGTEAATPEQDVEMAASPEAISLRDAKRKASEAPSDATRDRKRLREDSEAMEEEEAGPSTGRGRKKTQHAPDKKFQNVINMLHSSISQHRYGNIFHNPIKKQDASDYHDIVKRPMDLKTIKQRVKEGIISNSLEFQRDVYLMFANAMIYNRPGSEIHAMAEEMMLESEIQINAFRQTEGFHRL